MLIRRVSLLKRWPMTGRRWIELIFGVILPAIFVVPVGLFLIAFFGYAFLHGTFEYPGLLRVLREKREIGELGGFLLSFIVGIGIVSGVISAGLLVLFGAERVNRYPHVRRFTVATGVLGVLVFGGILLLSGYSVFIHWKEVFTRPILYDVGKLMREEQGTDERLLLLGSVGPLMVWLRHLPQLLKGVQ